MKKKIKHVAELVTVRGMKYVRCECGLTWWPLVRDGRMHHSWNQCPSTVIRHINILGHSDHVNRNHHVYQRTPGLVNVTNYNGVNDRLAHPLGQQ